MASNDAGAGGSASSRVPGEIYQHADMGAVWQRGAASRAQAFGAATDLMLDAAALEPGDADS